MRIRLELTIVMLELNRCNQREAKAERYCYLKYQGVIFCGRLVVIMYICMFNEYQESYIMLME